MSTDKYSVGFGAAWGSEETIETLKDLVAKAERGELQCTALRIFKANGTWDDVVIGGASDEERAEALAALQQSRRAAN